MDPTIPNTPEKPSRDSLSSAVERRQVLAASSRDPEEAEQLRFEQERETRQMFRRLLNPGIMRNVEMRTALTSMKTLLTLAENILQDPGNDKFKQFKPTNSLIKRTLIDVKGALEYAVAMGFRANVKDLQPYYIFNDNKMSELRIGAAVLQETLERESEKQAQRATHKNQEKDAIKLQAQQVKLAFEDDRKRKSLQDKLERERRLAREAAAAQGAQAAVADPASSPVVMMPGGPTSVDVMHLPGGRTLASPPPYSEESGTED